MKNTVFPHKFWRPFLDCMPQLFFRPQYVWFPVHLKGHLIPLCYETLVVNWQNWLFTLLHQSRSVLSPNPIMHMVSVLLCFIMVWCRIWSWSPMPCKKHGPRDSVDKNRGRRPRFLSLLRPEGHVFHTAWETMIKSYYSTLTDWFFPCFIHINMNFNALKWAIFGSLHGC